MMIRVATWNMAQVFRRKQLNQQWQWLYTTVSPDVIVLTEAAVPKNGLLSGWDARWKKDGIGGRRTWGTVIASRNILLEEVRFAPHKSGKSVDLYTCWPGSVVITDLVINREVWATLVGIYGLCVNLNDKPCSHGGFSTDKILASLEPLFNSARARRMIVAGDFNLLPVDMPLELEDDYGFINLIDQTADSRPPLEGCYDCYLEKCGHLWTHKNRRRNAPVQTDYIFASEPLLKNVKRVYGGAASFPDAWDLSDHAPVIAEFKF